MEIKIVLEAILVGFYSLVLFQVLLFFIENKYILLFTLGFCKHFLSYYVGLQTFYCNNGYACKKIHPTSDPYTYIYIAKNTYLFPESLLEGLWFLIFGSLLFSTIPKNVIQEYGIPFFIFFIGLITHILSEVTGIHTYFCKHNCKK